MGLKLTHQCKIFGLVIVSADTFSSKKIDRTCEPIEVSVGPVLLPTVTPVPRVTFCWLEASPARKLCTISCFSDLKGLVRRLLKGTAYFFACLIYNSSCDEDILNFCNSRSITRWNILPNKLVCRIQILVAISESDSDLDSFDNSCNYRQFRA